MIRDLVKRYGWRVFPLRPNTRLPYKDFLWRDQSSDDSGQIGKWTHVYPSCNWGVDCGKSGLLVVDIDVKKGKKGFDNAKALEAEGFEFPTTFSVATTTGGEHWYYTGEVRNSADKIGRGIDTRGQGGYVVAPGSTINGEKYEIILEVPFKPVPEWIKEAVGAKNTRSHSSNPRSEAPLRLGNLTPRGDDAHNYQLACLDQPHYIADAVKYLQRAPVSKEGQGGDDNAYRVTCHIRDLGVSEETAFALMADFWNQRCQPPWGFDELRKKVENAYQYSENSEGSRLIDTVFDTPVEAPEIEVLEEFDDGLKFTDLIKASPPPREWVIEDWIPLGAASFLTGEGGVGKSLIAMQLAASVALQIPWLGKHIETPMPVIAIMCEDSPEEIHRRAHAIGALPEYAFEMDARKTPYNATFVSRLGKSTTLGRAKDYKVVPGEFRKDLIRLLKQIDGPKLLILDTITDVFKGNENDKTTVDQFVKEIIGEFIVKYQCTTLSIGHPTKDGSKEYSGSAAWSNAHRNRLFIRYHDQPGLIAHRIVSRSKSNYASIGEEIFIQYSNGAYRHVEQGHIRDDVEAANIEKLYEAIVSHAALGKPLGLHHLSDIYFKDADILDVADRPFSWEEKKRLTNKLKIADRIMEVKGNPRRNGLYPKAGEGKFIEEEN